MSLLYTDDVNDRARIEIIDDRNGTWRVLDSRTCRLVAVKTSLRAARAIAEHIALARNWQIYER